MLPVARKDINYKLSCLRRAAEDGTLWESNPKFDDGESF